MYDKIQSLMRRDTWEIFQGSQLLITMCFQEHGPSMQEETLLDNKEIPSTLLCERGCPEETVSKAPELAFSSGTMGHSEVGVDFAV